MIPWTHITHLGDVAITTLAAFAITGWLYIEGEKRLACWWSALFIVGLSIVGLTKMAFIGWGIGIPALDFTGFSGHAMRAMAVIPVLSYLMLQRATPLLRMAGTLLGFACGVLVGLSRLAVHAHSPSEVISGMMLGAVVSFAFIHVAARTLRKDVFNPLRIALSVLVLLPAPYVQPTPTQKWLTGVSLYFSGHDKPFMRTDYKGMPASTPSRTPAHPQS